MNFQLVIIDDVNENPDAISRHLKSFLPETFEDVQPFLALDNKNVHAIILNKPSQQKLNLLQSHYSRRKKCPLIIGIGNNSRLEGLDTIISTDTLADHSEQLCEFIDQVIIDLLSARRDSAGSRSTTETIISVSDSMREILFHARRIAPHSEAILISGETGTGKDLLARHLHMSSDRKNGPFHIVNCAAVSPQLFDSEFFGHVKGAFTGAGSNKDGHFAYANGGTLVLDEIGELDILLQAKLLRAIENQEIFPVGSHNRKQIDVRIIALTNRQLRKEILRGRFREDLYHRLNTLQLHLPPLRERRSDIFAIAQHILAQTWVAAIPGWQKLVGTEVYEWLSDCCLSGNVRELRNLLLGAVVLLKPSSLKLNPAVLEKVALMQGTLRKRPGPASDLPASLRKVEERLIRDALEKNEKNITITAKHLGITRQNLQQRMRKLNMQWGNK